MKKLTPTLKFGIAWMVLVFMLAIHVVDEMATDFLPFYNALVTSIRETYPSFPMPTFTLPVWLNSLGIALVALLLSSPLVFEGKGFMRPVALVFGSVMVLNALGHMGASFYFGTAVPGVYSSPLLLIAAVALLVMAYRARPGTGSASPG